MAQVDFYQNELSNLLKNPGSFQGSPGFQFSLDQGLGAVGRSNSRMRGSGNALAALTNYGTGLAMQDYGNTVDRYGRLLGQEQNYDLGQGQNANQATSIANQFSLGKEQNANQAKSIANQFSLGQSQNANAAHANDQQFGLGMYRAGNDFSLGSEQNANTAQNNWYNYNLGQGQNANTAAANQNNFNLNSGRNDIDWFNAQTGRGTAQSNDYYKYLDWLSKNGGQPPGGY
jgi:hypothetical protein